MKDKNIKDLLEDSDKAESLEKLSNILDTKRCKVVIITGVPDEDDNHLTMEVTQFGFRYIFEALGFIQEGYTIFENQEGTK